MAFGPKMGRNLATTKGAKVITKEQALTVNEFHERHSVEIKVGPRGGKTYPKIFTWRRNGKTQTWVRNPEKFQIPVKFGMYLHGYITEHDISVHAAEDCPLKDL